MKKIQLTLLDAARAPEGPRRPMESKLWRCFTEQQSKRLRLQVGSRGALPNNKSKNEIRPRSSGNNGRAARQELLASYSIVVTLVSRLLEMKKRRRPPSSAD